MRKLIFTIFIISALSFSCATKSPQTAVAWSQDEIIGLTIELIDSKKIEIYSFGKDGVAMTFGRKNGFVTGPLAEWKIIDNRLVIGFWGNGVTEPPAGAGFMLISKSDSIFVLKDSSGAIKRFKVLPHQ
jgi:hypothetical protein